MSSATTFGGIPLVAKIGILFAILGVLTAIYYFGLHMDVNESIEQTTVTHAQLLTRQAQANEKEHQFATLTAELAESETGFRRNRRVLPADPEIPAFIQDLHRLGERSGVNIQSTEPQDEETETLYVRVPVRVQVQGRYHQVARFFWNVSQLDRAINMENVQLREPTVTNDEVQLSVDVLATTFRRLGDAEQGASGEEAAL